ELNNRRMSRKALSYGYVALVGTSVVAVNFALRPYDQRHPDDFLKVVFLCVAGVLLNVPQVRIEQGRLSLVGIANQAASMILNPLDASLVGLASSITTVRRGAYALLANAAFSACFNLAGAC